MNAPLIICLSHNSPSKTDLRKAETAPDDCTWVLSENVTFDPWPLRAKVKGGAGFPSSSLWKPRKAFAVCLCSTSTNSSTCLEAQEKSNFLFSLSTLLCDVYLVLSQALIWLDLWQNEMSVLKIITFFLLQQIYSSHSQLSAIFRLLITCLDSFHLSLAIPLFLSLTHIHSESHPIMCHEVTQNLLITKSKAQLVWL